MFPTASLKLSKTLLVTILRGGEVEEEEEEEEWRLEINFAAVLGYLLPAVLSVFEPLWDFVVVFDPLLVFFNIVVMMMMMMINQFEV